ncbi:MAG: hypothetical protein HOO93_12830 [Methyloglobulus sp.]|nr:hypothetical protein [Methyloglobulus sp.]
MAQNHTLINLWTKPEAKVWTWQAAIDNKDRIIESLIKENDALRRENLSLGIKYELAIALLNNSELKQPRKNRAKPKSDPKKRGVKKKYTPEFLTLLCQHIETRADNEGISEREAIKQTIMGSLGINSYNAGRGVGKLQSAISKHRREKRQVTDI